MKKNLALTITALAGMALLACGRPSSSNLFELDGVGDPRNPTGNPIPGRWGGSISMSNFTMLTESFSTGVFGQALPQFAIDQGYFNKTDIAGLGGLDLLLIGIAPPPRLNGERWACYMDPAAFPLLGGELVSRDLGEEIELKFQGGFEAEIERDEDDDVSDDADLLVWYTIPQDTSTGDILLNTYDAEVDIETNGGTLDNKGFATSPAFEMDEILQFPAQITGSSGGTVPTVNGEPMTAVIEEDDEYRIRWNEAPSASDTNLLGTQIVLTVYGPANFGGVADFDITGDTPFFNRLAQIVCLVADDEEEFTIFQSNVPSGETDPHSPFSVEDLIELATSTGKYEVTREDVDKDGEIDVRPGSGIPPLPISEDANGNNVLDRIYGISLYVSRRHENVIEIPKSGGGTSTILVSGNDVVASKLEYMAAPTQCNNGIDDDDDGDIDDGDDSGCADEWDNREAD